MWSILTGCDKYLLTTFVLISTVHISPSLTSSDSISLSKYHVCNKKKGQAKGSTTEAGQVFIGWGFVVLKKFVKSTF